MAAETDEVNFDGAFTGIVDLDRAEGIRSALSRICIDPACMDRQERLIPRFEHFASVPGEGGRWSYVGAAARILELVHCDRQAEPPAIRLSL